MLFGSPLSRILAPPTPESQEMAQDVLIYFLRYHFVLNLSLGVQQLYLPIQTITILPTSDSCKLVIIARQSKNISSRPTIRPCKYEILQIKYTLELLDQGVTIF